MYAYDELDRTLLNERVSEFRDQVKRRLSGELTEDEFKMLRLQNGVSPSATLSELEFPTLSSLILRWGTEEARMREFVDSLSEAALQEVVNYTSVTGRVARANTREHALTHTVFHGMQHRSECAVLLTNFGHSPGNIDLLYYYVEKGIA